MLDLAELEQFAAFSDLGTLTKTAEALHISQPTLTRTMRHVEDAFGVPLFVRGKNRIELNETGREAARQAKTLLAAAETAVRQVRDCHRRLHTIAVESCAPAPLWPLLPLLSARFPEQTVSSRLEEQARIVRDVTAGTCELGILTDRADADGFVCIPFLRENLSVCVPRGHPLGARQSVTLGDLNGYNCLLRSEIGFWTQLCRDKMPASRFLIQTDEFELSELIRKSTLLCFVTNMTADTQHALQGRTVIPVSDPEANVTYWLFCRKGEEGYIRAAEQLQKSGGLQR